MVSKEKRTDKPAFNIKFHDGCMMYYLDDHPGFTPEQKGRFFRSPEVKVLFVGLGQGARVMRRGWTARAAWARRQGRREVKVAWARWIGRGDGPCV